MSAWTVTLNDIEQGFKDAESDEELLAAVRGLDNQYRDRIAELEAALAEAREVVGLYATEWEPIKIFGEPDEFMLPSSLFHDRGACARAWLAKYEESEP